MSGMIVVGLFTVAGFILGAVTALVGVSASRPPATKKDEDIANEVQQILDLDNSFNDSLRRTSNDR